MGDTGARGRELLGIEEILISRQGLEVLNTIISRCVIANRPMNSGTVDGCVGTSDTAVQGRVTRLRGRNCLRRPRASTNEIPACGNCQLCMSGLVRTNALDRSREEVVSSTVPRRFCSRRSLIESTSGTLTRLANYTAFVSKRGPGFSIVSGIRIVPANEEVCILLVVASGNGVGGHAYQLRFSLAGRRLRCFDSCIGRGLRNVPIRCLDSRVLAGLRTTVNACLLALSPLVGNLFSVSGRVAVHRIRIANNGGVLLHRSISRGRVVTFLSGDNRLEELVSSDFSNVRMVFDPRSSDFVINGSDLVDSGFSGGNEITNRLNVVNPVHVSCQGIVPCVRCFASGLSRVLAAGFCSSPRSESRSRWQAGRWQET